MPDEHFQRVTRFRRPRGPTEATYSGPSEIVDSRRLAAHLNKAQGTPTMPIPRRASSAEVISDRSVMGGEPVVRGTRIPAATIAAYLAAGRSDQEIFEDYPSLPVDGIDAVRRWRGAVTAQRA